MAIKIHCSSCGNFIKDVDAEGINQITGKEICSGCAKRIEKALQFVDDSVTEFKEKLEKQTSDLKKAFASLDTMYKKFSNDIVSLRTTISSELRQRVADMVSGKTK